MNLREKIKSYSFWVSLGSAVILILKVLGSRFGFRVDETMISDLFTALCSILVILGIIVIPQPKDMDKQKSIKDAFQNSITEPEIIEPDNQTTPENIINSTVVAETAYVLAETTQETQPEFTKTTDEKIEPEVEDINIEPIINQTTDYNKETIVQEDTKQVKKYNELYDVIKREKEKYSDNMAEFIKILQDEINSTKSQEEANF